MSKSTRVSLRPSADQDMSTTQTSKARAVRSNATSWAQDDEDDDYVMIEKPAEEEKRGVLGAVMLWKKAVKKVKSVGMGKGKSTDAQALEGYVGSAGQYMMKEYGRSAAFEGDAALEDGNDEVVDEDEEFEGEAAMSMGQILVPVGRGVRGQL